MRLIYDILLNEKEIEVFTNNYMPEWKEDIIKVTSISYNGVDEYLINDHYLLLDYGHKIETKDLQITE